MNKDSKSLKRKNNEIEENINSSCKKQHISSISINNISTTSSLTIGSVTITPVTSTPNSTSSVSNSGDILRYKEQKEFKHKDMKRDRERDRDRDRGHDRMLDRVSGSKDERIRRESGMYNMGHYNSRDDDHWLPRDGRDIRDGRDVRDGRYVKIYIYIYIMYKKRKI